MQIKYCFVIYVLSVVLKSTDTTLTKSEQAAMIEQNISKCKKQTLSRFPNVSNTCMYIASMISDQPKPLKVTPKTMSIMNAPTNCKPPRRRDLRGNCRLVWSTWG